MVKKFAGAVPVHPVLGTVADFDGLPAGTIISVTGHDDVLFEYAPFRGVFVTLFDGVSDVTPAELVAEYSPVRLVWLP